MQQKSGYGTHPKNPGGTGRGEGARGNRSKRRGGGSPFLRYSLNPPPHPTPGEYNIPLPMDVRTQRMSRLGRFFCRTDTEARYTCPYHAEIRMAATAATATTMTVIIVVLGFRGVVATEEVITGGQLKPFSGLGMVVVVNVSEDGSATASPIRAAVRSGAPHSSSSSARTRNAPEDARTV